MKLTARSFLALLFVVLSSTALWATPVGVMVGYDVEEGTNVCNINAYALQNPMFTPYNRNSDQWWYNVVEEVAFSNVPFIALNVRGDSPCSDSPVSGNEPASTYPSMAVNALDTRGYNGFLKLAYFDDTAAAPTIKDQCGWGSTIDLSDSGQWETYFWDIKIEPFFNQVDSGHREYINGHPLLMFWRLDGGGYTNLTGGNLPDLIDYIRSQFYMEYGEDPFIVADTTWTDADANVESHADGVEKWFTAGSTAWETNTISGNSGTFTVGMGVPGFWEPTHSTFQDRDTGGTFQTVLSNVMSSDLVLLEGWTDIAENIGMYRGSRGGVPSCSSISGTSGQLWAYPNQYMDKLRTFTSPDIEYVVFETEGSDDFDTTIGTGSGLFKRDDDSNPQDIQYTDGSDSNWAVLLGSGSWAQYVDFSLGGDTDYHWRIHYKATGSATAKLFVDSSQVGQISLSNTSGSYADGDDTGITISGGAHDIRVQITGGSAYVDNMTLDGWGILSPSPQPLSSAHALSMAQVRHFAPALAQRADERHLAALLGTHPGLPFRQKSTGMTGRLTSAGPWGRLARLIAPAAFLSR